MAIPFDTEKLFAINFPLVQIMAVPDSFDYRDEVFEVKEHQFTKIKCSVRSAHPYILAFFNQNNRDVHVRKVLNLDKLYDAGKMTTTYKLVSKPVEGCEVVDMLRNLNRQFFS